MANWLFETVEKLLETDIDHYVYMDLSVFRKAIDLLGGVEYYVPQNMVDDPYQNLHIHLKDTSCWTGVRRSTLSGTGKDIKMETSAESRYSRTL